MKPKTLRIFVPVALFAGLLAVVLPAQVDHAGQDDCTDCEDIPGGSTTFVQELEAIQSETLSQVVSALESVPADRLDWKPTESSPSILELCNGIANDNRRMAVFLRQRVEPAKVTTGEEAIEQVRAAFEAVSRGIASIPPDQDPADVFIDTSSIQASLREVLMRHAARNARLLGELKATARFASEQRPAG